MATRWTEDRVGTIYEGSSTRTADQLNACVVLLAAEEGWDNSEAKALTNKIPTTGGWFDDPDDSEAMAEAAEAARDWLTENVAPENYSFTWDDGLVLISDDELEA